MLYFLKGGESVSYGERRGCYFLDLFLMSVQPGCPSDGHRALRTALDHWLAKTEQKCKGNGRFKGGSRDEGRKYRMSEGNKGEKKKKEL